jgi:hypothetical protein
MHGMYVVDAAFFIMKAMSKVMAAFDKKTLMVTDVGCFFSACSWRARAHASEILSALKTTTKHNAAAQQSMVGLPPLV